MQWMYDGAKTVPARMSVKDFTVTLRMSLQLIGCNLAIWKFLLQEAYLVLYTIVWGLNIHTFCVWKPAQELIKI